MKTDHPIRAMCEALEVSASGYYDWSHRQAQPGPGAGRHGLRRQSAAATALSPARASRELSSTVARTKAAWRCASRRSP